MYGVGVRGVLNGMTKHLTGVPSVGIVLGQFAIVLGFTSTVPILEYYTAVH